MPLPPSARIAQSAEQTVDNRSIEGSNLSSCTILEGGVTGNSGRSERSIPGSNPGLPELWLSYNGGVSQITRGCGPRNESSILSSHPTSEFKSLADCLRWKQAAVGSIPATRTMRVKNDGHSAGLQTQQREFESHHVLSALPHQGRAVSLKTRWIRVQVPRGVNDAGLAELVYALRSKRRGSEFKSQIRQEAQLGKLANPPDLGSGFSRFESETGYMRCSVNGKPCGPNPLTESSNLSQRAILPSSRGPGSSPVTGRTRVQISSGVPSQHSNEGSRACLKNRTSRFNSECWHQLSFEGVPHHDRVRIQIK